MTEVITRKSKIHGVGLFATRDFAAGELILPIDDSRIVDEDRPLRPELGEHQDHCDYLAGDRVGTRRDLRRLNLSCA